MKARTSPALARVGLVGLGLVALVACDKSRPTAADAGARTQAAVAEAESERARRDAEPPGQGKGAPAEAKTSLNCGPPAGTWYLHLSDIHLGTNVTEQVAMGDTSVPLWDATKAALRERLAGPNPPAFILYTGDLPDHDPDRGELHTTNIAAVLADLKALAGTTPLLYLPGNNDSLDWDYAAFSTAKGETPLSAGEWAGPALNVEVEPGANPAQGYYSAVVLPGLRVVALNTVLMSASYPCAHQRTTAGACDDSQDAEVGAELDWLAGELTAAAAASQKVLLAMHIPPGVDAYQSPKLMWGQEAWEDRFLALLAASEAEIVGLAYGHTHLDELRRIYDAEGELVTLALSAPGITPGHGNNPGFKAIGLGPGLRATEALTWYASAPDPAKPVYAYADTACYRYTEVFGCRGTTLAACLGSKAICPLSGAMDTIYTVHHGAPSYDTAPGIDVRPGPVAAPSCGGQ